MSDLEWLGFYYGSVFPEGAEAAHTRLAGLHQLLSVNPYLGRPSDTRQGTRVLPVPKTPFKLIYRVTEKHIEILRLKDTRDGYSE
ncbi:MAG: type II toxin-antitoxin system RelE/ParE family toxin [Rhodobacteraceae bacterium]|nr:type II toxin-antitoxin system RelE/ParE family toxin [Paracoccaceae bacterium]